MKNLLFALLIMFTVSSCATYKRCSQKFQTATVADSVKVLVPVTVTVPKDSVVTSFVTDTTYLYKEIQQGRARVIVERTNTITTVQAKCDSVLITKTIYVKVPGPRVVWGVSPRYKTQSKIGWSLLAAAVSLIIILLHNRTHLKKELANKNTVFPS
jgi:hypothetical protein